jgi:lambda family phage portal protein
MAKPPSLIDPYGVPIATAPRGRRSASLNGSAPQFFPHDAAQWTSPEMGDWLPWIRSADAEFNIYRDRVVARSRDLVRNDGWAAGSVNRILDSTIGGTYRLSAQPDYRALAARYGAAFDAEWAADFRRTAEALWRGYSEDVGRWNDLGRQLTVAQQLRLALRHQLIDGESLAISYWRPDRIGRGAASYATAFQIVDPDRLSNPYQSVDTRYLRGGVEVDDHGAPLAYHIRRAHQNDWYNAVESMEWERVVREDDDGWRRVIHAFDTDRAGQNRGIPIFAPVISRMKMLARYYGVELQAAAINAVFGTYITSPFDQEMVEEALNDGDRLGFYQAFREEHHEKNALMLGGARIPTLAPGEAITSVSSERPMGAMTPFAHEMLRGVAAVLGVSAEQVTQDYSETNYSSARAGIVEAEKTGKRRVAMFNSQVATPVYANWLHEAMDRGELPLPKGAPDFIDARTAYSRCKWLGTGRGWIDPQSERAGEIMGMDAGFSTLENVCAEIEGADWEETLDQRQREVQAFKDRGLEPPTWANMQPVPGAMTAEKSAKKPTAT